MARVISAMIPTADHSMETALPRNRDSDTRGLLRRIIRLVRQVMAAMLTGQRRIAGDMAPQHHLSGNKWLTSFGGPPCIV